MLHQILTFVEHQFVDRRRMSIMLSEDEIQDLKAFVATPVLDKVNSLGRLQHDDRARFITQAQAINS